MIAKLEDLGDVRGKTVLVRTDFNVPMAGPDDNRVIVDDFRIRSALETLNWLTSRGANVVCATHLGRPSSLCMRRLRRQRADECHTGRTEKHPAHRSSPGSTPGDEFPHDTVIQRFHDSWFPCDFFKLLGRIEPPGTRMAPAQVPGKGSERGHDPCNASTTLSPIASVPIARVPGCTRSAVRQPSASTLRTAARIRASVCWSSKL